MITAETALRIARCYREIAAAEKLLEDTAACVAQNRPSIPRDVFGREPRAFEFGVPSGDSSHRLFDVSPTLADSVIRAHIANKRAALVEANEQARIELNTP